MTAIYLQFAKDHRHLYEVMMSFHTPDHDASSRQDLWLFTVEQVERLPAKGTRERLRSLCGLYSTGPSRWSQPKCWEKTNLPVEFSSD